MNDMLKKSRVKLRADFRIGFKSVAQSKILLYHQVNKFKVFRLLSDHNSGINDRLTDLMRN